jgi:chromosome segregation ATPase
MNKNIKKNKNDIEDLNKKINQLKDAISDINNKLLAFNEEFDKVKVKVQDFNVYDLFKGGSGEGNLDAAKVLVMNLENKIFKKFALYDERNKKMDKDFYKMQEDVKNALVVVDGMKTTTKRNTDSINELNENFNTTKSNHENYINEIQRKIELITNKINSGPDFSQIKKEFDKKLKELEEKLNSKIDLFLNKETTEETHNGPALKVDDLAMIKDLRRRIGELEKLVSNTFDRINADDMKNRISILETEMPKRASKYEVNELKEKLKNLDEFAKDLNFKVDSLQQFTEKIRLDLSQIIKKIEFLSGEYSKLAFNKSGKSNDEGKSVVDMSKFIDFNVFNDNKKDVNNKFEKVRLGFEDLSREIEEILAKLAHTPTDKDFSQFQTIIKNLIEDLKINCNKKYADKYDTAKSIKFLETQIKTIHESVNKRNEVGDNWLLAKKPINSYVCASCEASIRGELDKRTEYVAWNRYPQREDKAYRLGHGFSRMLQMVNEDIIKSAGEKGYSSDEDKKLNIKNSGVSIDKTYLVNASVKLPKVTKRKPAISSAAPLQTDPNVSSSPYDDADNVDNSNNMNKPQIVRVIRKNKPGSPTKNSEVVTHRSNEYSINEKNMPSNEDLPPITSNENDK